MKRKNNKGFTLIEILGAIVILGIISTIAVPAVYKYVTKSKDFSYENMYKTVYDAVKNYRLDTNDNSVTRPNKPTYTKSDINELVELNYLDPLIDPADKNKKCSAEVYVFDCVDKDKTVLRDHVYSVKLSCSAHSNTKTFNDNGDLMSNDEYGKCLGSTGSTDPDPEPEPDPAPDPTNPPGDDDDDDGSVGSFTVEGADLKYNNKKGDEYKNGTWTNKNVWIGNFKVKGIKASDIDHFEYSVEGVDNISVTAEGKSFGKDATEYVFSGSTQVKFRLRVVDKKGNVSIWSNETYEINIDVTNPEVVVGVVNSNNNFNSKTFIGEDENNNVTQSEGWIGVNKPSIHVTAKDGESGVNNSFKIKYNITDEVAFVNPINWSKTGGKRKFTNKGTYSEWTSDSLGAGYRVVRCIVTDNAGNKTVGIIKFKVDLTPPSINMKLLSTSDSTAKTLGEYDCHNDDNPNCSYVYSNGNWLTKKIKDRIKVDDGQSGIDDTSITVEYNKMNTKTCNETFSPSSTTRTNNSDSDNIADGCRYIRYTVKDVAGNKRTMKVKVQKDTTGPDIVATYKYGNSTIFTADTTTSRKTEYTYSKWINSSKQITVESINVTDGLSGVSSTGTRQLMINKSGTTGYDTLIKKGQSSNMTFTSKNSYTYSIEHEKGAWTNGYRAAKYTVTDVAGNTTNYKVKFKVDTVAPTGSISVSDQDKKVNSDNNYKRDFDKVYSKVKSITVKGEDETSGIQGKYSISFNEAGKTKCSYDDTKVNKNSYSFSSGEHTLKNPLSDGCRSVKITLTDNAGNTRTMRFMINQMPVGCHYYDYYIRKTGYSWKCSCKKTHSSDKGAHFVVCKHTDGKYYGVAQYYRDKLELPKSEDLPEDTLGCPNGNRTPGSTLGNGSWHVLSQSISNDIDWSYYGSPTEDSRR